MYYLIKVNDILLIIHLYLKHKHMENQLNYNHLLLLMLIKILNEILIVYMTQGDFSNVMFLVEILNSLILNFMYLDIS